jgi:hypothetical protein
MAAFKPYADDAASLSIGEMKLENGGDHIAIYGNVDLTRDKAGLAHAKALKQVLDDIVRVLEGDPKLPDAVAPPKAAGTVKNPFG